MNTVSNFPFGSFHAASDQELTGWFDASASLTVSVPYTPQEYYNALTGKAMILNNQMKGYGEGCMDYGFYYSSQMMFVEVPEFDFATTPLASPVATERRKLTFGGSRHLKSKQKNTHELCFESGEWDHAFETEFEHKGCQKH